MECGMRCNVAIVRNVLNLKIVQLSANGKTSARKFFAPRGYHHRNLMVSQSQKTHAKHKPFFRKNLPKLLLWINCIR